MVAHPLVGDYDIAKPMLEEMLIANKEYIHPGLLSEVAQKII